MSLTRTTFLILLLLTALPRIAAPVAEEARPDVLLITIDTLRPDALGWVAGKNATPALDALAQAGARFPAAVSPVPLTAPAHASLLTGLDPLRHGVRDNGQVLGPEVTTLAEQLRAGGWRTAAFVGGYPLRRLFGLDQGFDHYDDELPLDSAGRFAERPAEETVAAALAWIAEQPRTAPWFVWIHFYDPHDPYTPPARFHRPGPHGAYLGEVARVDAAVAELERRLPATAERPRITVVTADHGESLGEHGEETHGFFIYDATMLVPLVFHAPGRLAPGASDLPARLIDVAPTLLELLGLQASAAVDGVSLMPALAGRPQEIPPAFLETLQPWLGYGWAPLFAVRTAASKLIAAPRPELYDLGKDPGELTNRVDEERSAARRLAGALRTLRGRDAVSAGGAADDPEVAAQLRALGYTGGASSVEPPTRGLADPKDRLAEKRLIADAEAVLAAGDPAAALARFDAVLERDADNPFALQRSGVALLALGRPREAAERLERAVARAPDNVEARYHLADALSRAGDTTAAVAAWRAVVALQPGRAVAWSNLGALLLRAGDAAGGVAAVERAAALAPDDAQLARNLAAARYQLALVEVTAGRRDAARTVLAAALAAAPDLRPRAASDPRLAPLLPPK